MFCNYKIADEGFKPRFSDVKSKHSINCSTTTCLLCSECYLAWANNPYHRVTQQQYTTSLPYSWDVGW